jgi:quercetin dioxygenase-like cupin family protein
VTAATPKVQVDTDRVRVTEWRFEPGAETGWHVHELDYIVIPLYDGRLRVESHTGTIDVDLVCGGSYGRSAGVEHNVMNANAFEFAFVEVELKPGGESSA